MRTLIATLIALLVFVLPVASATAQVTPDTTEAERPFVEGGAFDRPFLTTLLGRTAIGGYAETHARWERADGVRDGLGFQLKRWNIFTATQVNDFIRIGAELEFEELAKEINLESAAIDVTIHPMFTLRAGAILAPVGRFNLSHDSPRNEFTDRPLVSTEIIGTALTEPGLGALGVIGLGARGRVTYELYAVNGFHDGLINDSPDGTRIPLGKGNPEDNNASPAFVGRVAWSPAVGYELGFSGHHGAYNQFALAGERVDTRSDLTILAIDGELTLLGAEFSGEAVDASIDITPGLDGVYASAQRGFYAQVVRPFGRGLVQTMPTSFFEVAARYDQVDFDADKIGDSVRRGSLGVNFRPSQDVAIKLNYIRGRSRDRFNNPGNDAGVLFSIATYF